VPEGENIADHCQWSAIQYSCTKACAILICKQEYKITEVVTPVYKCLWVALYHVFAAAEEGWKGRTGMVRA